MTLTTLFCPIKSILGAKNSLIHWGSQRPTAVVPISRFPEKVTVWCAISSYGVLGPYFFEENGQNLTVNGRRYHEMFRRKFLIHPGPSVLSMPWTRSRCGFSKTVLDHTSSISCDFFSRTHIALEAGLLGSIWTTIGQLDHQI